MKKISILVIAIALLLCLTGCPTSHPDYSLSGFFPEYLRGSQTSISAQELVWNGSEAIVEFTYSTATNEWGTGAPAGTIHFGITGIDGWNTKWTGAVLTVGGGYVTTTLGHDDNNKITGVVEGTKYRITIKGGATVQVKVDAL